MALELSGGAHFYVINNKNISTNTAVYKELSLVNTAFEVGINISPLSSITALFDQSDLNNLSGNFISMPCTYMTLTKLF